MRSFKFTYLLLIVLYFLTGCRINKSVPEGKYLIKKNIITISPENAISSSDLDEFIRQKPNTKSFAMRLKLRVYNSVDSLKVAKKRAQLDLELREKNLKKKLKEEKINKNRIEKAKKKNKTVYVHKVIPLQDTTDTKMFFREWLKYKFGEAPVIFDSIQLNKSQKQLTNYLKRKGYLNNEVCVEVEYKKHKKSIVSYDIHLGDQYTIDSLSIHCENPQVNSSYNAFKAKNPNYELLGKPFDVDMLEEYRDKISVYMRNDALYGFSSSNIKYLADTMYLSKQKGVILTLNFTDRQMYSNINKDSIIFKKHQVTNVNRLYFHIIDTSLFSGNFLKTIDSLNIPLLSKNYITTLDTLNFQQIKLKKSNEFDPKREATFLYNGEMFLDPALIEVQNYLEQTNYYKEKYVDRSYSYLQQTGLFQSVKIIIDELPNSNLVDVHYYLVPAKKQSFGFSPKGTNSNGYLGVNASLSYTNKNLFKGAEKLTFSISGGFESQPPILDKKDDGTIIQKSARSFNTFEIGPNLKLELPGLFPIFPTKYFKRQRARTTISSAYNYQRRSDFTREIFQLNYLWKFLSPNKTQVFQAGLPFASVIKYVDIKKSDQFQEKLDLLNDVFLRNTYRDQFIWEDFKFTFEYKSTEKEIKSKNSIYYLASFDNAGWMLSKFKGNQDTTQDGHYTLMGLAYSQFTRLDNQFIYSRSFSKNRSIHFKANAGGGLPYGNLGTSMPYDYSFFAGGANDIRGWRARSLGPGGYKYYLDTNYVQTQVADLRISASAEYRFKLSSIVNGAIFIDAGNIWTINEDINRPGSQISKNWINQIAISSGFGFRFDFDFFIIRTDLGIPLRNPALPKGGNWLFQSRDLYNNEIANLNLSQNTIDNKLSRNLFMPILNFGIGYPF